MSNIKLAIVGATGAVGREFLRILAEQQFPAENLFLVASSKSAGKAIKYFEKAIRLNPKLAVAYHNVGVSQLNLGRKTNACSDFKKAAYLGRKFNLEWLETDAGKWCRQLR